MPTQAQKVTVKAIIPADEFALIYGGLQGIAECRAKWCPFSRTTCYVRQTLQGVKEWWQRENGDAPGLANYERVLQTAIRVENKLYWCFCAWDMKPCEETYERFTEQMRLAFSGKPIDIDEGDWD